MSCENGSEAHFWGKKGRWDEVQKLRFDAEELKGKIPGVAGLMV